MLSRDLVTVPRALVTINDEEMRERATMEFERLKRAGVLPESIKNIDQAIVIARHGADLDMPPHEAFKQLFIVKGQIGIRSAAMKAVATRRIPGLVHKMVVDGKSAKSVFTHPTRGEIEWTVTLEDAAQAGWANNFQWKGMPKIMLAWRSISQGLRFFAPDVFGSIYSKEELDDMEFVEAQRTRPQQQPPKARTEALAARLAAASETVVDAKMTVDDEVRDAYAAIDSVSTLDALDNLRTPLAQLSEEKKEPVIAYWKAKLGALKALADQPLDIIAENSIAESAIDTRQPAMGIA